MQEPVLDRGAGPYAEQDVHAIARPVVQVHAIPEDQRSVRSGIDPACIDWRAVPVGELALLPDQHHGPGRHVGRGFLPQGSGSADGDLLGHLIHDGLQLVVQRRDARLYLRHGLLQGPVRIGPGPDQGQGDAQ